MFEQYDFMFEQYDFMFQQCDFIFGQYDFSFEQYDFMFEQYDFIFEQYGSWIDPGSILDLSWIDPWQQQQQQQQRQQQQMCLSISFMYLFRDLSRNMRRKKSAPEARKQRRAPDNLKMMSKQATHYYYC